MLLFFELSWTDSFSKLQKSQWFQGAKNQQYRQSVNRRSVSDFQNFVKSRFIMVSTQGSANGVLAYLAQLKIYNKITKCSWMVGFRCVSFQSKLVAPINIFQPITIQNLCPQQQHLVSKIPMNSQKPEQCPQTQTSLANQQESLFKQGELADPGQLLWSSIITRGGNKHGFLETRCSEPTRRRSFQFLFEICFRVTYRELMVQFFKDDQTLQYVLEDCSELIAWRNILRKKLNQRGFHQLYKPLVKLGKGTFATVFSAKKLEDNSIYAVKAFSKESTFSDVKGKATVKKELQIMRCLANKNIMKLYEIFESEQSLYIIFEYLDGGNLQQNFKEEYRFSELQAKNILKGLLLGLRQMHIQSIMHRDIKPENVMFRIPQFSDDSQKNRNQDWSSEVVIADLGLAEFTYSSEYLYVRCGTPGYVAPEIINLTDLKSRYTTACDIYSLGLIFHSLLLGKTLFPGKRYNEVLQQNRNYEYTISGGIYSDLPKEAVDLLEKMLIKDPRKRISSEEALKHPYIVGEGIKKKASPVNQYLSQKSFFSFGRGNSSNSEPDQLNPLRKVKNQEKLPRFQCMQLKQAKEGEKCKKGDNSERNEYNSETSIKAQQNLSIMELIGYYLEL